MGAHLGSQVHLENSWLIQMELQLQVTEEELLEFPEVRPDQINTSHTDNSAGEVVLSAEKSSYSGSVLQIHHLRSRPKNHTIGDQ